MVRGKKIGTSYMQMKSNARKTWMYSKIPIHSNIPDDYTIYMYTNTHIYIHNIIH